MNAQRPAHLQRPGFHSRVVPVITLTNAEQAVPLARALLEGGIDVMEITLRSEAGLPGIEAVARAVPQMCVGAGTLTQAADVQRVCDAGATFGLSPGCSDALVQAVVDAKLPFVPGVMTPSEVMRARDHGFRLMKLFPASQAGGKGMLQALGAPLSDVQFCPTGGVSLSNLREFLSLPNVAMVGGSWLTPAALMRERQWGRITELAQEATQASQA